MSKREAIWFGLFLIGMGLIKVQDGYKQVCWNVGIGIVGWTVGHVVRENRR